MDFMRRHWFDVGFAGAAVIGGLLLLYPVSGLELLLWLNLVSLLLHQFEEYRFPGYFPGMVNTVMFSSDQPDRYPLNMNAALIINIAIGWAAYFVAALFGVKAIWLGMAAVLVSAGNFIAHTFLFNIKGKTWYNPGMATSILLFGPIAVLFFVFLVRHGIGRVVDWTAGIILGIVLNYVGVLKLIDLMKTRETRHIFPARFMIPRRGR
jgi:hypothetical protein